MNGHDLRIFAHATTCSSLARPRRPPPPATRQRAAPPLLRVVESPDREPSPQLVALPSPPVPHELPTEEVAPVAAAEPSIAAAIEQQLLDILVAAPEFGETIDTAYRRKERELAEVFASLNRTEASTLHRRLSDPRDDDALARRFARLVVERRTRLLAILADMPRRLARR